MIRILKRHRWFDALSLIVRAREKSTVSRYVLETVLMDDTNIVATDGHRLHYRPHSGWDELPLGKYEVIVADKQKIFLEPADSKLRWPKYRDILPHHEKYFDVNDSSDYVVFGLAKNGVCVSSRLIADTFLTEYEKMRVWFGEPLQPVQIVTECGVICIIIPKFSADKSEIVIEVKTVEDKKKEISDA